MAPSLFSSEKKLEVTRFYNWFLIFFAQLLSSGGNESALTTAKPVLETIPDLFDPYRIYSKNWI